MGPIRVSRAPWLAAIAGALAAVAVGLLARGDIGGEPAAFLGRHPQELYVALHDGTIKRSTDGEATWTVRSTP